MLLSVKNLKVSYGNIRALHGIDFQIDDGEIVCIIGANGAGKSTTLRAISRLVPAEEGTTMTFMGNDLLQYPADKVVSKFGISHVPEGRRLFGNLTIMENLRLATFARKDSEKIQEDLERIFSIFPRLEERKTQKSGTLSGGEQQMLAIGRAFMSGRRIMLLDEPSMGLAPLLMLNVFNALKSSTRKEQPFYWWSRMPGWRFNLHSEAMCSKAAIWFWKEALKCCLQIPKSSRLI